MEEFLLAVGGLGVLVSACVNIGKTLGLIKDGQGEMIVNIMNPFVYLLFLLLPVFGVELDWAGANLRFESVGEFLQIISMTEMDDARLLILMKKALILLAKTAAPITTGIMLIGIVANVAQVGFLFTLKPLMPKFE